MAHQPEPLKGRFYIDTHEGRGKRNYDLQSLVNLITRLAGTEKKAEAITLDIGDIIYADENGRVLVVFERKTPSDFDGSIKSGHIKEQFARMGLLRKMKFDGLEMPEDPEWPQFTVLLPGDLLSLQPGNSKGAERAVVGTLSRFQLNFKNTAVLPMSDDDVLPAIVVAHVRRVLEVLRPGYTGYDKLPLITEIKALCRKDHIDNPSIHALASLTICYSMSPDKAEQVLKVYKHLPAIYDAVDKFGYRAFTDIPTIGRKTAEALVKCFSVSPPSTNSSLDLDDDYVPAPRSKASSALRLPHLNVSDDDLPIRPRLKASVLKRSVSAPKVSVLETPALLTKPKARPAPSATPKPKRRTISLDDD